MRPVYLLTILFLSTFTIGEISDNSLSKNETIVSVDSTNLRFSPSSITISEGDSVRFFWSGELLAHNAVAEDELFDSGDPSRNVDYTFTFDIGTNGTHTYVCEPHESVGMVGTIIVEPSPITNNSEDDTGIEDNIEAQSEETWIPFFGLELVFAILLFMAIYHYGMTQGLAQTSLLTNEEE